MSRINRRTFVKSTALGAATVAAMFQPTRAGQETIRLGLIGCGWYGGVVLDAAFEAGGVSVSAVCDVDLEHLDSMAGRVEERQGSRPATHSDYQELLDRDDLDAIVIATPPQWHALPFIEACRQGYDIFLEKPVAYDIREGQVMMQAAEQAGVIVQVGFQRRQSEAFLRAAEFVREGGAGRIVQVDAQIHYRANPGDPTIQDPPESLDWDMWCGPAPKLPYRPSIGHFNWRLEEAYGNGHLADWGIHLVDAVRNGLGVTTPSKVTAAGGIYHLKDRITTPDTLSAHFEFEGFPLVWRHRLWGAQEFNPEINNGIFFFGDEATVFATDDRWIVTPAGNADNREVHQVDAGAMQREHVAEFLEAVRNRTQPSCPIEDGFHSTATVQLAMIAYDTQRTIRWDEQSGEIVDDAEAAERLKRDYRDPWTHPYTA